MRELIELIKHIHLDRLKANGLWSIVFERDSKMEQLCEAIALGLVATDEEAASLLYGSKTTGSKYLNLRERLKERLVNAVFLLEFKSPGSSERHKAYFECNRKWAAVMVLLNRNAKLIGIEMLESLLKQAQHFEFTELTMNILSILRLHYGTIQGDASKYDQYRDAYRHHQQVWMVENEAEEMYTHLVSHFVNSKATKNEIADKAQACYDQIAPTMAANASFRLHLCGRLIQTTIYSSRNDYTTTAEVCEDAISFFKNKNFDSNLPLQAFYYQLVVCYIQLREFERGQNIIRDYQSLFDEGSFNWLKLQESYFLLSTHTRHYETAIEICERVAPFLRNPAHPAQIQEMWKIYEAYVQYLMQVGKAAVPANMEGGAKFKRGKFLNDIPTFSKDKRGMNIPILVIQILFSLSDKNYHQAIDRIEAIEKYCSRYLTQGDTFRSNCFIKLLLQIPAASFHREAVLRKSETLLKQLQSVPLEVAYQTHEIEIIPYEHLWDMVMEVLQNQIYKGR